MSSAPGSISEAASLLVKERVKKYGDPSTSFKKAAILFYNFTGFSLRASDIALILICLKLVREGTEHNPDNALDVCGYADIYGLLREEEEAR